jgi:hypothetical protein
MGGMMLRNKKSREGWMSGSIAGNPISLPMYRITPAEGVVLHNSGIDRVAQLFGVNDLNGRTDPKTNGSEVEGGLFAEELVTRYPLIVIKCNSLGGKLQGRDSLWALPPPPPRALPQDLS